MIPAIHDTQARHTDTVHRWAWRVVVDGRGDVITPAEAIELAAPTMTAYKPVRRQPAYMRRRGRRNHRIVRQKGCKGARGKGAYLNGCSCCAAACVLPGVSLFATSVWIHVDDI